MMIRYSSEKMLKSPYVSGLRLGFILVITLMIISSSIVLLVKPPMVAAVAATSPDDGNTLAPSTIGQDGSGFTTQAALGSVTARPTNNIVTTNSFYDIVFTTATAGAIKTIEVTFPAGTTIPSALVNEVEGIGPGSASKTGPTTITYTVANAVNVPAGTRIRLEITNINNPVNPSASYTVMVTTKNAANTPIDGPTPSTAFTMKQLGASIIAPGSITPTKPAESFMKRVTVEDDTAGHGVGWDPGGGIVDFLINEPAVGDPTISFVNVWVESLPGCQVSLAEGGVIFIQCIAGAPFEGATLNYVVENLPAHVIQ
jgi:hypothetical protein